jgi:hypothetical protein
MYRAKLFCFVALFLISLTGHGQSFYAIRRERSLIAVGGLGTSTYFGELANPGDYIDARPSLTAGLQYYLNKRISIRTELGWFQLQGDDKKADAEGRIKRNLSFISNNFEFNATGQINLLPNGLRFYQRPILNAYVFAGIGLLYFNPKAEYQGRRYALQPLRTEGVHYNRLTVAIPHGIGVRYMIDPFWNINFEIGYRKVFTDYLDDVSTVYVDNNSFTNPIAQALADRRPEIGLPVRPAGSIRGNPKRDDGYALMQVKVEYYLPYSVKNNQRKLYNRKRKYYYRRR